MRAGSSQETTPLLVDPPIDDESYRHEARTFPSDEQKHLMFASYALTSSISRLCEVSSTLFIALCFPANMLPIAAFSFAVLASSTYTMRFSHLVSRLFKSRMRLLATTILEQRLPMFCFALLILYRDKYDHFAYQLFTVAGLIVCLIWLKASFHLYQVTYRREWLQILSNGKDSISIQFEKSMHGLSVILQLLLPVFTGLLASSMHINDLAHVMAFIAVGGLLVELSLVYKLHSTCYALYLPRPTHSLDSVEHIYRSVLGPLEAHPMIGVLTTPLDVLWASNRHVSVYTRPLTRILKYVKRKPVPVTVTFGVILINVSLITIGPHMVWFLIRRDMNTTSIGVFKMLQTLVTLHPAIHAKRSFTLTTAGALLSVLFLLILQSFHHGTKLWTYLFAASVVVTRLGVPTINLVGEQFVEDYLADEEIHKVYRENAVWLRTQCELLAHVLIVIFPSANLFVFPIVISAILMLVGRTLILNMIENHWSP